MSYDLPKIESSLLLLKDVEEEDVVDLILQAHMQTANGRDAEDAARGLRHEAKAFMTLLANSVSGEHEQSYYLWIVRTRNEERVLGFMAFAEWSAVDASIDFACVEIAGNETVVAGALQAVIQWAFGSRPSLETISTECRADDTVHATILAAAGMAFKRMRVALCTELRKAPHVIAEWATVRNHNVHGP